MVGHPAHEEAAGGKAGAWGGVRAAGEGWKDSGKCELGSDGERRDTAARNCASVAQMGLAIRPVQEAPVKALPSHCTGDKTETEPCSDLPQKLVCFIEEEPSTMWLAVQGPFKGGRSSVLLYGQSKCLETSKLILYKPQSNAHCLSVTSGHREACTHRPTSIAFF